MAEPKVQVSPFHRQDLSLGGLLLHGRWPNSVREWAQLLVLAVRIAAVPGTVPITEVFRAKERPEVTAAGEPIGIVVCEGPAIGAGALGPGAFAGQFPPALMLLHPPQETTVDLDEDQGAASGCLLLPGIPELGLAHRATWVQADSAGNVSKLVSRAGVHPLDDPDVAVMATLLAS